MRNFIICIVLLLVSSVSYSQYFPETWIGNWSGELNWWKGAANEPRKEKMQLRIQPSDSVNQFSWQIIYGSDEKDNRPYILKAVDTAKAHWQIDEQNGIVLDQYFIAGKFSGAFTVQSSTIINNYWLQGNELHVEFYNISAQPVAVTGLGTEESPSVNSYQVKTYQKAVLYRTK